MVEAEFEDGQLGADLVVEVFGDAFPFDFLALEHGYEAFFLDLEILFPEGQLILYYLFLLQHHHDDHENTEAHHNDRTRQDQLQRVHDLALLIFWRPI